MALREDHLQELRLVDDLLLRKKLMDEIFESTPRWPGAPRICLEANLPAFDTPGDAKDWFETRAPGVHMESPKLCMFCGLFHCGSAARGPAGESSGSSRYQKHKRR